MLGRTLVALVLAAAALPSLAADRVWRGTIGTAPVVVELSVAEGGAYGRYFYERHRRDIPLEGRRDGAALHLHEASGEWTLRPSSGDGFAGEWVGGNGRRLPVQLARFRTGTVTGERAALARDNPFGYLRTAALKLQRGRLEARGAYRLQWYVEPSTEVALFRVVAGYDEATRGRLNRMLASRHWQEIAAAAECRAMESGEYDVTTTLRRIAPTLLSVSVFSSFSCGGAHPDFGDSPINIDPRTGRALDLEDVLWLGRGAPPRMQGATQDAFFSYRDKTLAPWLAKAMARLHPREVAGDECEFSDPVVWRFPSWYATDAGLYIGPSFPRVARACEYPEWSVLPWREVRAHPGSVRVAP